MKRYNDVQNANAPAIMPFAVAGGKSKCASRVIGYDRALNINGGITSLSL